MARFGVKENCKYLGETWSGYFANDLSAQDIAEKVMQERFKKYSEEYKDSTVKTEVSENSCRLDLGDGDFIEIFIEDLDGPYRVQFSDYEGEACDGGAYDTFEDAKEAAVDGYHTDQDYNHFVIYNKDGDVIYDEDDLGNEDGDLPKFLTIDLELMNKLGINPTETDGDEISDIIGEYLSDEYGFCHYGFEYDVENDHINVYNIEWDTSNDDDDDDDEGDDPCRNDPDD